jgi:Tfp pilus assembly protein PilV
MNRLKDNKGMTLMEIVVAFILFMLIVTFFAMFFVTSMKWTAKSNKDTSSISKARMYTDNAMISDLPASSSNDIHVITSNSDKTSAERNVNTKIIWRGNEAAYTPTNRSLQSTTVRVEIDSDEEGLIENEGASTAGRAVEYKVFVTGS